MPERSDGKPKRPYTHRIDAAGESEVVEREVLDAPLAPPSTRRGGAGHDLAETSARRARAVRLRLSGLTYEQIADELGYTDKAQARNLVMRALDRVETKAVQEYRDVQHARLERVHAALWPLVVGSHRPTRRDDQGREVLDAAGRPVPDESYVDPDTRIKAAGMVIRNAERDARLIGMDAPQRLDVSAGSQAQLEDALMELREILTGHDVVVGEVVPETSAERVQGEAGEVAE